MPSKFTENFGLNQWDATDRVHHDDFNEDNRKIDAAFLNHRSAELIDSVTVEEESYRIDLDISQVDWSRYMALAVLVDSESYTGFYASMGSGEKCLYILAQSQVVSSNTSTANLPYAAHMTMLIPVFYDGNHEASVLAFAIGQSGSTIPSLSCGGLPTPLNQCTKITINHNSKFAPGERAALWGIK